MGEGERLGAGAPGRKVSQDRVDGASVLDAGEDPKSPAAGGAGLDVDAEHTPKASGPAARDESAGTGRWLVAVVARVLGAAGPALGRDDASAQAAGATALDEPAIPEPKSLDEARELVAELIGVLGAQQQRIEALEEHIRALGEKAGTSSRTSSKPPLSDSAAQKATRPERKPRSQRRQGAQPGHTKHERPTVPPEALDDTIVYVPNAACGCGAEVVVDAEPRCRHQVVDLPPVSATVVEHQLFSGTCAGCGRRHAAQAPSTVPSEQMGPGLIAWIALLSSRFHLSTRKIQALLAEQWQLHFSLGAISEAQGRANGALVAPYLHVARHVRTQPVVHADETRHYRGPWLFWLWAMATHRAVYFMTHPSRGMNAADQMLGDSKAIVVTDDYAGYNHVPEHRRQLCWAHLLRYFTAMGEHTGRAGKIGRELELLTRLLYRVRHRLDAGRIDEPIWRRRSARLRRRVRAALERGARLQLDGRTKAQCAHLLVREPMLWTHLADRSIPIDNNLAECAIRPYVL